MSEQEPKRFNDRLSDADGDLVNGIREIFRVTRPLGPPFDFDSLFDGNRPAAERLAGQRRVATNSRLGIIAILTSIAALFLVTFYLVHPSQAAVDFVAVLDRIEQLQSVQYTQYSTKSGRSRSLAGDATVYDPQANLPAVLHVKVLGKHRQRSEVPDAGYDLIDSESGTFVTLHPGRKLFRRITTVVRIDPQTGEQTTEPYRIPPIDFYSLVRVPVKDVQPIGIATIDDLPVIGFRRTAKAGLKTWTTTIWVDPDTQLPIRIETSMRTTEPGIQQWDIVATDFVFDESLDESLFDTTPPDGYDVIDGKVIVRP